MAQSPSNPHDAFFRKMLSHAPDAASEIRAALPNTLAQHIDWDMLELRPCTYVSQHLQSRVSDLLFRTRLHGRDAFVYVLIEHQSRPDPLMPMRMLEYMVGIWTEYIQDHSSVERLPAVIPLVVHASPDGRSWSKPTELADLIDVDPVTREALGDLLPRFRFLLDDLTVHVVSALCGRDLTPASRVLLVILKVAAKNKHLGMDLLPVVEDLNTPISAPGGIDTLECVATYIMKVGETPPADLKPLLDQLGPDAKEVIMTTAEQLRAEGEARGLAKSLLAILAARFGPVPTGIATTIHAASVAQLEEWTTRALEAESVDEVFVE
ncbi:Rpn family recombination-promoting nuclease/putative transposase [Nocardia crassostreae]|uniref:Rpn family recombination-promoting nuclease/putative transposase n=1 Tax=Nocardia crassostreae TaxID=53428 RepID=UPI000A7BDF37|nr:Rpn family recombination-promoting nuclease/putative transposase [Nocardia crassostreae]